MAMDSNWLNCDCYWRDLDIMGRGRVEEKAGPASLASEPVKQAAAAPIAKRTLIAEAKPTPISPRERDDLTRMNGIGPKIARILNDHGIFTFEQLAATEVSFLEGLMVEREWHWLIQTPGPLKPKHWPKRNRRDVRICSKQNLAINFCFNSTFKDF